MVVHLVHTWSLVAKVRPVRVEPGDDVIYQPLHDEIVLLNMKTQQYFALDDVGSRMWKCILENSDPETVADKLSVEYEVDRDILWKDLNELIQRLVAAGLLRERAELPLSR